MNRSSERGAMIIGLCVLLAAATCLGAGQSSTESVRQLSGRLHEILCDGRCPCQKINLPLRANVFADVYVYTDPDAGIPCAGLIVMVAEWRSGREVTTEMFIDFQMDGLARLPPGAPEDLPVLDDTYSTINPKTKEFNPRNLVEVMKPDELERLNSRYADVLQATLRALTRANPESSPRDTI